MTSTNLLETPKSSRVAGVHSEPGPRRRKKMLCSGDEDMYDTRLCYNGRMFIDETGFNQNMIFGEDSRLCYSESSVTELSAFHHQPSTSVFGYDSINSSSSWSQNSEPSVFSSASSASSGSFYLTPVEMQPTNCSSLHLSEGAFNGSHSFSDSLSTTHDSFNVWSPVFIPKYQQFFNTPTRDSTSNSTPIRQRQLFNTTTNSNSLSGIERKFIFSEVTDAKMSQSVEDVDKMTSEDLSQLSMQDSFIM